MTKSNKSGRYKIKKTNKFINFLKQPKRELL